MFLQDTRVDVVAPVPSLSQQPPVLHLGQNLSVESVPGVEPLQGVSNLSLHHIIDIYSWYSDIDKVLADAEPDIFK